MVADFLEARKKVQILPPPRVLVLARCSVVPSSGEKIASCNTV